MKQLRLAQMSMALLLGIGTSSLALGFESQARVVPPHVEARELAEAPIVILFFASFHCPYSAGARVMLEQLQAKYPGQIRVVVKHFPLTFDRAGYLPHEAALAAEEQGKFWEMYRALYDHRDATEDRQKVEALAKQAGLDLQRFRNALNSRIGALQISADRAEARALKVTVTPTFYIGGFKLEGTQSLSVLDMLIGHELSSSTQGAADAAGNPVPSAASTSGALVR